MAIATKGEGGNGFSLWFRMSFLVHLSRRSGPRTDELAIALSKLGVLGALPCAQLSISEIRGAAGNDSSQHSAADLYQFFLLSRSVHF